MPRTTKKPAKAAALADPAPAPTPVNAPATTDALELFRWVSGNPALPLRERMAAAKVVLAYTRDKPHDGGKKLERQRAAENVGSRFAAAAPPRKNGAH